jgi:selenocysteine lyase/cysteine desulfurase
MPLPDLRPHFSRFLSSDPGRLHFAAHSHHPWPDVTRAAQLQCWDDAARLIDDKWEHVLGPVLEEARGHIARHLALADPKAIAVAPNTHELLRRLLSCFPAGRPVRILTTDGEFHSFTRQVARLAEDGVVEVERIAQEPHASFAERFAAATGRGHDLVYLSQVLFESGFAVLDLEAIAAAAGEAYVVFDGYHGFMARPTDLSRIQARAFYIAGGYKYAMAGEGICFMHCPPGWGERPRDTGWYAAFAALSKAQDGRVPYAENGWRFMGATFDPSGLYRFNAVMRWVTEVGLSPHSIHAHAVALQQRFIAGLPAGAAVARKQLVVPLESPARGNFLTFQSPDAADAHDRLKALNVITDVRGSRLRIGFGIYLSTAEVDELCRRIARM